MNVRPRRSPSQHRRPTVGRRAWTHVVGWPTPWIALVAT